MKNNIPRELRQLPQWVVAAADKVPLNPKTGGPASVTDPTTWGTFEQACRAGLPHVGFVLAESDPYTIIDLDDKPERPATDEQKARFAQIVEAFDSYTERSSSGRGVHIIVRGKMPAGVHRDNVEVYSSARYMICTGDVMRPLPIADRQNLLDAMYSQMKPAEPAELEDREGALDDEELVAMAMRAANADKFNELCRGDWQAMGYESQSEADMALLSILAYYSLDNEQVRRIFRMSNLGQREKAQKNDKYLNYALGKIRAQQPPLIDMAEAAAFTAQAIERAKAVAAPLPQVPATGAIAWPPGLVGELAQHIYNSAIRPVPEVALVAALGLVAGIAGRQFNTYTGAGLNLYLMLTAKTGRGKEGIATGIEGLIEATKEKAPPIVEIVGPGSFASGPAVHGALIERPCFVSVLGEFGLTLQEISEGRTKGAAQSLGKALLDVYTKSGPNKVLRAAAYSNNAENGKKPVSSPALTIVCEGTPETFYNGLTPEMIAQGLISRFIILDYEGKRPERNEGAGFPPSGQLVQRIADLVNTCNAMATNNARQAAGLSADAKALLDAFDKECDNHINGADGVEGELWNRAHLNALKVSALLAVGCTPHAPMVTVDHARWAIALVRRSIESLQARVARGEVGGSTDSNCERQLRDRIRKYIAQPEYAGKDVGYQKQGLIRWSFLGPKVYPLAAFEKHPLGAKKALKDAVQHLIECGVLTEVKDAKNPTSKALIYQINTAEL